MAKSRKIILNIAISLDGVICDDVGTFGWIVGHDDVSQNSLVQFDFAAFLDRCDTIVMGRKAYDDCGTAGLEVNCPKYFVVATTSVREDTANTQFVSGDIVKFVTDLKSTQGKDIWLFGGAGLVEQFLKADVIDEYVIGIIPTILGRGRKLFYSSFQTINLHLDECTLTDGIAMLRYSRRK